METGNQDCYQIQCGIDAITSELLTIWKARSPQPKSTGEHITRSVLASKARSAQLIGKQLFLKLEEAEVTLRSRQGHEDAPERDEPSTGLSIHRPGTPSAQVRKAVAQ